MSMYVLRESELLYKKSCVVLNDESECEIRREDGRLK